MAIVGTLLGQHTTTTTTTTISDSRERTHQDKGYDKGYEQGSDRGLEEGEEEGDGYDGFGPLPVGGRPSRQGEIKGQRGLNTPFSIPLSLPISTPLCNNFSTRSHTSITHTFTRHSLPLTHFLSTGTRARSVSGSSLPSSTAGDSVSLRSDHSGLPNDKKTTLPKKTGAGLGKRTRARAGTIAARPKDKPTNPPTSQPFLINVVVSVVNPRLLLLGTQRKHHAQWLCVL